MAQGLAAATGIQATPTIKINGQEYQPTTPDALVAKIKEIVGNILGLEAPHPTGTRTGTGAEPQAPTP